MSWPTYEEEVVLKMMGFVINKECQDAIIYALFKSIALV